MRFRILFALAFASVAVLPLAAHAAIPFFGPIIPGSDIPGNIQGTCAAGWGMLIDVVNRIIEFSITIAIVFVAPLMIAYAGFLFVVNPVNAGGKEQAKKVLTNTIVGIVIALAGWMIVDAIMAVLYNGRLGAWSDLITSGNALTCLPQQGVGTGLNQSRNGAPTPGISVVPPAGLVNITAFSCKNASSCQVSSDVNARLNQMKNNLGAAASQYQITETGVNTTVTHASGANNLDMSCFAPCTPSQVKAAIAAWPGSVKYETDSQSVYNFMITAGVPSANILGPAWFTGRFDSSGTCSTGTGHCITASHMSLNP